MSVLVVSKETFEKVFVKAVKYTFGKTLDIDWCVSFHDMNEHEIAEVVKIWCRLNEESYCIKYEEKVENKQEKLNLNFNRNHSESINTYQMLKSLQCINYNIEEDTINQVRELCPKEKAAMKILYAVICQILHAIVNDMIEYQQADWG